MTLYQKMKYRDVGSRTYIDHLPDDEVLVPVEPVKREDIQRIMVEYDGYRNQYPVPSLSDTVDALMASMAGEDSTP